MIGLAEQTWVWFLKLLFGTVCVFFLRCCCCCVYYFCTLACVLSVWQTLCCEKEFPLVIIKSKSKPFSLLLHFQWFHPLSAVSPRVSSFAICNFSSDIFSIRSGIISKSGVKKCCLIVTAVSITAERYFSFTQARSVQACWLPAVVFDMCLSAAFWMRNRKSEAMQQLTFIAARSLLLYWYIRTFSGFFFPVWK